VTEPHAVWRAPDRDGAHDRSSGTVTLLCGDSASTSQVEIQFIKITAIKAGTLSTEGL
jgi:hypothetical protein